MIEEQIAGRTPSSGNAFANRHVFVLVNKLINLFIYSIYQTTA